SDTELFLLERFLPYRLSIVAQLSSTSLARLYAQRYGLSVPQWRVMAMLGRYRTLTAAEICDRTLMDKVAVSRAVSAMLARGLIERAPDPSDRRRAALRLSPAGQDMHREIVPLARRY